MRRVLFIAYLFPPIANSGTRRSLSFANHLPDQGWEPTVLTLAHPPPQTCDVSLLAEVRAGTRVERAPSWSGDWSRRLATWCLPTARQKQVADALEWRLDSLLQVPDSVASWCPKAISRGLELHRQTPFDLIYASGWPWTSFLVAREIGRKTGRPYVLDYRDMWRPTGTHEWEVQSRWQAALNPRLEIRAARDAAALITVTPSLVEQIQADAQVKHIHCITNGFEPSDFDDLSAAAGADDGLVRISYTGVWRPGYGLEDLYRAVRHLKDIQSPSVSKLRVSAAGFKPGPAQQFGVDDVVQELGPVPHEIALRLMREADALYLPVPLGYYATASLPGKLFEYLGSGRPIITVVPQTSEVARVTQEVGGCLRIEPGDIPGLAQSLDKLCQGRALDVFSARRPENLARYTRAETTRELAAVFDLALLGQGRG